MKRDTDIDLDVKDRNEIIEHFPCIAGCERILDTGEIIAHKSGVHFDNIPYDPITGTATIPYKQADDIGYQKIDFLNVSAYKHVRDRAHLIELLNTPVKWELFNEPEIVGELFQLKNQFSVISIWPPKSIEHLAMLLAIIRPAKRHLQLASSWEEISHEVWDYSKNKPGLMGFKASHAYAYAHLIVVQLNALVEHLTTNN